MWVDKIPKQQRKSQFYFLYAAKINLLNKENHFLCQTFLLIIKSVIEVPVLMNIEITRETLNSLN